jgi:hypothetical protein
MNKVAALILVLVASILVAAYVGYPYFALRQLGEALRAQRVDAVDGKVDWPAVRQGIRDDVNAALRARVGSEEGNPLAGLGMALAGRLAKPAVDATMTPTGLIALAAADRPSLETLLVRLDPSVSDNRTLPRLIDSGFSGLTTFNATVLPDGAELPKGEVGLRFELEGGYWMLTRVHLPADRSNDDR